jgi:hypothetical protein
MKWDWGKGIVVAFIMFCSFVVTIVVLAFQEDFDLVSETYYQDELTYQQRINDKDNLRDSGLKLDLRQEVEHLVINFPDSEREITGVIHFYNPAKAILDKKFPIALNELNEQFIDKSDLAKGRFKVQVSWDADGKGYYQEEEVFLK